MQLPSNMIHTYASVSSTAGPSYPNLLIMKYNSILKPQMSINFSFSIIFLDSIIVHLCLYLFEPITESLLFAGGMRILKERSRIRNIGNNASLHIKKDYKMYIIVNPPLHNENTSLVYYYIALFVPFCHLHSVI